MVTKLETKFKTFRCEVKSADPATGVIEMLIPMSTDSTDRSEESIAWDAWTKRLPSFLKRPILVSSHDYSSLSNQIGKFVSLVPTKEGLMGKPQYHVGKGNFEADWGFFLASIGEAAYSVGFIPYEFAQGKAEGDPAIKYTDCDLLEISQVVVPCNRDTIQAHKTKSLNPAMGKLLDSISEEVNKREVKKDLFQDIQNAPVRDLTEKPYSQTEIKDELDFCLSILKESTLNPENVIMAKSLISELHRLSGSDIPVNIKTIKVQIKDALDACQSAMDCMSQHDLAHQTAFKAHGASIIRCYNGLKSLYEASPEGTNNQPSEAPAEQPKSILSVFFKK